jgi:hypothetical protein
MNKKTLALIDIARRTGDWESCLASFPMQHQWILKAIANKSVSPDYVARRLIQSVRSIGSAMAQLHREGVLARPERGLYSVVDKDFAVYLDLCLIGLNKTDVSIEVENTAYRSMVSLFESLEHQGLISGNGHHIAQKIAAIAKETVLERWKEKQ